MIKFFRKIRQKMLTENKFSEYLLYAVGEIILVVIGILIALSINNWNQRNLEQDALSGYLTSISNNIKADNEKIEFLKTNRINLITRIPHMTDNLLQSDFLERIDVKFASEILNSVSDFEYFNADLSGFESIKNSGYLRFLQGEDIEILIYKYYNLVKEITAKEKDYNEILRNAYSTFSSTGFENFVYITYPDYIGDENELKKLQPYLKRILFDPSALGLYNHTFEKGPALVVDYDNLNIIGKEIIRMVESNRKALDVVSTKNLENIFNANGTIGYSKIITNGAENSRFFDYGYASDGGKAFDIIFGINEIIFKVPELEWAVVYYRNPSNAMVERPIKDYSGYKTLKLELKGDKGGEKVFIALKDADDPDDGSETAIPLLLTSEWKTFEIPLIDFKTANLKKLFIVVAFIFRVDAQNISVRNVEYVK